MEVYAYGNVDALRAILNAIVMVFGAADFQQIIRVVVILGFLFIAIPAAFNQQWRGWSWLLSVTVIGAVALTPKTDVIITDKVGATAPSVVSNVPYVLGLMVSVKSQIGHTLTQLFETAFQTIPFSNLALPAQLSYQEHGVMWGSKLIRIVRETDLTSPTLKMDVINYMRNCTFPVIGKPGLIDPQAFWTTSDLWSMMATTNVVLYTNYHDAGGNSQFGPCPQAYTALDAQMGPAMNTVLDRVARYLYPQSPAATVTAQAANEIISAAQRGRVADAAATASSYTRQNVMINLFGDTAQTIAITSGDAASVMAATARAQAVQAASLGASVEASMAEEAGPMLRNIVEMIVIGLFPIIVLLLFTSEGKVLAATAKTYLYALLWVELWPVVYAVLNFISTNQVMNEIGGAAAINLSTAAMTLATASGVYDTALQGSAVAGRMAIYVPLIAAALLWGMDKLVGVATARDLAGTAVPNADAVARGNVTQGAVSFDQQLRGPAVGSEFKMIESTVFGDRTYQAGAGAIEGSPVFTSYRQSSGPIRVGDMAELSRQASQGASRSFELGERQAQAYEQSLSATFETARALSTGMSFTDRRGETVRVDAMSSDGTTASDVDRIARTTATKLGIDDVSAVASVLRGQLGVSALGSGGSVGGDAASRESVERTISEGREALHALGLERQRSLTERFSNSDEFSSARQFDRSATTRVQEGLQDAEAYRRASERSYMESERQATESKKLAAFSRSWNVSYDTEFYDWVRTNVSGFQDRDLYDPVRKQELLRDFALSGVLVDQVGTGLPDWAPNYSGAPVTPPMRDAELLRSESLTSPTVNGGRDSVANRDAGNEAVLRGAQAHGLSAATRVSGSDLRQRAVEARAQAQAALDDSRYRETNVATDLTQQAAQRTQSISPRLPSAPGGAVEAVKGIGQSTPNGTLTPQAEQGATLSDEQRLRSGQGNIKR